MGFAFGGYVRFVGGVVNAGPVVVAHGAAIHVLHCSAPDRVKVAVQSGDDVPAVAEFAESAVAGDVYDSVAVVESCLVGFVHAAFPADGDCPVAGQVHVTAPDLNAFAEPVLWDGWNVRVAAWTEAEVVEFEGNIFVSSDRDAPCLVQVGALYAERDKRCFRVVYEALHPLLTVVVLLLAAHKFG